MIVNYYFPNLENVECLKLYVSAPVPQHVHDHLEVLWIANVARHYSVVVPVK